MEISSADEWVLLTDPPIGVKIGNSPAAPRFDVVASPSDWAKTQRRSQQAAQHWTEEEFLAAIEDGAERAIVNEIFRKALATSPDALWFGRKPGGQVNVHPHGFHEGPFAFLVSDGRVSVFGLWNSWSRAKNHPAFADIAVVLSQSHEGSSSVVPLSSIDPEHLWPAGLRCAERLRADLGEA